MPLPVGGLNNQSQPGDGGAVRRRCGGDFRCEVQDRRNFLTQAFRLDRERRPLCQPRASETLASPLGPAKARFCG